jgi:hypothetical protein
MEFYGILRNFKEFYGILRNFTEFYGILRNFMEIVQNNINTLIHYFANIAFYGILCNFNARTFFSWAGQKGLDQ